MFLEARLDATVSTVRLMTIFMEFAITGSILCRVFSARLFTLAFESRRHGMNLSKI